MPRRHRLTRAGFRAVDRQKQRRVHGAYFSLTIAPGLSHMPEAACVVSKKVSVRAPERNRLKRRCRAALRLQLEKFKMPVTLILHAKREAAGASFDEIRKDIEILFERVSARGTIPRP